MKVVIDIPEEHYKYIQNLPHYKRLYEQDLILEGTPLPKGHGRLIDADAFISMLEDATERQRYKELMIDDCLTVDDVINAIVESLQNEGLAEGDAPTIITADKAESEE